MAIAGSSSSWNDVFISFRGEDTRKIFVGHLYRALDQKAIPTFIDSEELQKGNDLSKLLNAIEDSRLSIVVFSKDYASSTWCLKELVKILECMDAQNQIVVPVFYEVDPSHVRNLKGSFAQAFAKYEDASNADQEEVHGWKTALTRATNLSGWDSRHYKDDGELIEKIVEDTFNKLIHVSSSKAHGLVGMDYHLNEMYSLLGLGVDDVRFVGIWGMGGIGKTTIAKAVYDEIAYQFNHCCFLADVKEGFKNKGKEQIQADLLSRILNEKVPSTGILNRGSKMIMERLGKKKVLLVLDDLDDIAQIETLLGEQHSFGGGSRIILTTRDKQSLSRVEYQLYNPKCLSYDDAHELFMKYAFRTNKPSEEYDDLSRRAIHYAQGLPLALKVLGASLYNRSVAAWEDTLKKIKETPERKIQDVLRTSFDGLEPSEKNIFLDVACFFRGYKKIYATNILNICGFFPNIGLQVLIDKALVTIRDDRIEMHDLLVEMGREIGRASRLWSYQDISRVLTENTATEAVEAVKLDLSFMNIKEIYLNTEAFVSMTKLRLLMIDKSYRSFWSNPCKQHVSPLKFLSHQLRLLVWHGYPLESLPSNFNPQNLVELSMPSSNIVQLWEGTQRLGNLKSIDLRDSQCLRKFPDCSQAINLETLNLSGCTSLLEVHPSISDLKNLAFWSLRKCKVLETLPSSIYMKSLKSLDFSGCSNLERFPEIRGIMEELAELCLDETAIVELPSSINNLTGLVTLSLKGCKELKRLPSSIHMKSLKTLILSGCSNLAKFTEIRGIMKELRELCLDETGIEELPSSIEKLMGLVTLSLKDCRELKSLPISICLLKSLECIILSGCSKFEVFPIILEDMEEVRELHLDGTSIKELSPSIERLKRLIVLNMRNCSSLVCLPDNICNLSCLASLILSGCSNIYNLPKNCENLESLLNLQIKGSRINGRAFDRMVNLRLLQIHDNTFFSCKLRCLIWDRFPFRCLPPDFHPENLVDLDMCFSRLEQLWEGRKPLRKLQFINLSHSPYLMMTCDMTEAPRLKKLILEGCTSLFEVHPSISHNDTLVFLNLKGCRELKMFPSPICMKSLRTLNLSGCSNLEKFPEISEDMMELSEIDLDETAIKELPSSIERLRRLKVLSMRNCRSLVSLPDSICTLAYLQQLYLAGCSKLYNLPDNLSNAQALTILQVQGSGIEQLPFFMRNKETVRDGVIRVSGEGMSSELGVQVREEVNLIGVSGEGTSSEIGVQVEECSEAGGILGDLCSCLSCLRELFHRER